MKLILEDSLAPYRGLSTLEAKGELVKRFEHEGLKAHILEVETTDKMTDRQVAAKVRECFQVPKVL